MKSLAEIYERYKHSDVHFGTDKGTIHSYIETYERLLADYRRNSTVLEIGVGCGQSIRMWKEFFIDSRVIGTDISDCPSHYGTDLKSVLAEGHDLRFFNAADPEQCKKHLDGLVFDVIIEDADDHNADQQLTIYNNLRGHLAPDGIYIIEDIADLDRSKARFQQIDFSKHVQIVDLRKIKGRFDDVLVVIDEKTQALNLPGITVWACVWSDDQEMLSRTVRVLRYCQKILNPDRFLLLSHLPVPAIPGIDRIEIEKL